MKIEKWRKPGKNVNGAQSSWPVAYRWSAIGTLVIYTAVGMKTVHTALAQNVPAAVRTGSQTLGAQPSRHFEIPPGTLASVVRTFEQVTAIQVTALRPGILALPSPGVIGLYTPEQALQALLKDTGLAFRFTSTNRVAIDLKSVASTVEVTAAVEPLSSSSPKFAAPLVDTPQTITAVNQEVMQQQGITTLRDTLRNVAGISLAAGEGGSQGDNLTIRGFTARNDLFIDGMRDFGSYYRDPFNTKEVEVLQGPASVTFGRGSTGGVVNQATKSPELSRFVSADVLLGSDRTRRGTLDLDRPLPQLGRGAAFRLNVMGQEANVAGRDVAETRRFGIAPSLSLGINSDTRWTFGYFHQNADDTPDYGIPWLFNGPAPVPMHSYYGFEGANFLRTYDDIGTLRVEHTVNGHVTLRNQVRFANYVRDALITEPQVANPSVTTPLSALTVNRRQIGVDSVESFLGDQLDLSAHFETGFLRHEMVAGVEAGRETSDPTRQNWSGVPATNLLNPTPYDPFTGTAAISSTVNTVAVTTGAYVMDSIRLNRKWIVSGGFRWDRMDADYKQLVGSVAAYQRVDNMPSWRAALVYKPVAAGSIYFDAGTSFNPSAESLSLSATTASLPPEKNRTYEFGTKWDLPDSRLSLRAALFQTEKLNAREPDPLNPALNVLAGTQHVRGVQFEVRARLTSRWDMLASYAYIDGKVASSNYYPAAVGAQLANVPRNTFNLWTTYRMPWHLEVAAGGNFVSSRTASSTSPFDPITGLVKQAPAYWLFNAMAKRRLTEHVDLQANIYNLANRYYYDQLHPGHIVPGAGRSALLGFQFRF